MNTATASSSVSGYSIRALTKQDLDAVLDLLQTSMPDTTIPKTREFWEWKHVQNPFGESPGLVALNEGKIIGLRVFLKWMWQRGNQRVLSARAVDTATHPEWQGKGIFSRLTNQLIEQVSLEGARFIFNTPNRFSLPGYLKMGWKVVTRVPLWIRPIHPLKTVLNITRRNQAKRPAKDDMSIQNFLGECGWIQKSLDSPTDFRLQTMKTVDYVRWRYAEIPALKYHAKWRQSAGAFAAIIFREKMRQKFQELSISEIFLSSGDNAKHLAVELLKQLCLESEADYAVATSGAGAHQKSILRQAGFFYIGKRGPVLTVRRLGEYEDVMSWSQWNCSIGDLELF